MSDRAYFDRWYAARPSQVDASHHGVLYDFLLSKIPERAPRILDVGCGDGALTNRLPQRELTVGIDFSVEALRSVRTPVACAGIDALPFADDSFDLVLATEILEHLPVGVLDRAISEIARVTKSYCIISVPNRERLEFACARCPGCSWAVHPYGHMQRFDPAQLSARIHPHFRPLDIAEVGPDRIDLPGWLIRLRRLLFGEPLLPMGHVCPVCGYAACTDRPPKAFRPSRHRRGLSVIARKRPYWLVLTGVKSNVPFA